ncbi:hypothetical protein LIER_11151 [Lithospermum erythrorhizon]|uniref:Uncharacterized GPI-anchored protein At5g19230-like domain-containing protein n=1 Tax=Lithospermum erythrorhizon TaxID=34254 RepID=A0AAV3PPB4_LITER
MASFARTLVVSMLMCYILFINHTAKCDNDSEDSLFQGINQYRTTLNLSGLTENDKAECLADEMADQFKGQPCTNTTGSNTVQGNEPQFANYPRLLAKCDLNVTNTRDGKIMPVCVPNLNATLVLSNYTLSQYSQYLNDTAYTGIGIGTEENWMVVVLTTNTSEGSFVPANGNGVVNFAIKLGPVSHYLVLLSGFFMIL